jgi:Mg2+-importing ATPase
MSWQRDDEPSVLECYWSRPAQTVAAALATTLEGLTSEEAVARLRRTGPNELREHRTLTSMTALLRQLQSPLLLLLVIAAVLAGATGEWVDSALVLVIVVLTVAIGWSREYRAAVLATGLRARVKTRARVLREGREELIATDEIVAGDVVRLAAGSLVPADGVLIEASDLFVNEAALTGESFPVEKRPGAVAAGAPIAARRNCVFLGTNVRAGSGLMLVVRTAPASEYGAIARRLMRHPPETEFDRGIRHFGYLLSTAMLVMVTLVFVGHVLRDRPPTETLLFAVALAVGLSPELLPAVLSVNLARAAGNMAERGVLVRRLNAIENLGSLDVLCTDKTGTITEGVVSVEGAYGCTGERSATVFELAARNAALSTGIADPLNEALVTARVPTDERIRKIAEIPFDAVRRRASVVYERQDRTRELVTKGAMRHMLDSCECTGDGAVLDGAARQRFESLHAAWSRDGIRVLAVARRTVPAQAAYSRDDERGMTFEGFVTFVDRPKAGVADAIAALAARGVNVKIITGDNLLVAQHVAAGVGLHVRQSLTGRDLNIMADAALWRRAETVDVFAEVDPHQKERIILALKKTGHVVGFLGDGVNDAPAMHAADTSLAVEQAVDVARETADFVLLERGLDVIRRGIDAGRETFANTLKYILITTSANLGNMISMAAASFFLPFLPLTAGQVLLNNFLSDVPAVGLATDRVDRDMLDRPRRWNVRFIGRHMVTFGAISSAFDLLTFVLLLMVFRAGEASFQTGWFVESLLTELFVALVLRTRGPLLASRPGPLLLWSTVGLVAVAVTLPMTRWFGLVPIPPAIMGTLVLVTALYVVATETMKRRFYRQADASAW